METLGNEIVAKSGKNNASKYYCEYCHYNCSKKYNWEKHLNTDKHNKTTMEIKSGNEWQKNSNKFECDICNKLFTTTSGLWKHNKKCKDENNKPYDEISDKELIVMLIKENSEFKNMMFEQSNIMMKALENGTYNNSCNTNNSHNKSFNLQFFLNETCKDAMNIMDFVNSIQLQLSDLESVGKLGYVEGISNIITTNLKALDVTQRPVHCTDKKRETMYVKDENKWEKEDDQKNKIRKAIKKVATKNMCLIPKFKEVHPDCSKVSSKFSDQYNKIIVESCGGSGENDSEKEDKIIRNISKLVTIEKE